MSEEKLTPEQQILINSYLNSWSSKIVKAITGIIGVLVAIGGISGYAYISNITTSLVNSQISMQQSELDNMKKTAYEAIIEAKHSEGEIKAVQERAKKAIDDAERQSGELSEKLEKILGSIDGSEDLVKAAKEFSKAKEDVVKNLETRLKNEIKESILHQIVGIPIGTILPYAGSIDNDVVKKLEELGWLLCFGQEKGNDEDKFKELFKTIQYSWGKGEAENTFFLPDLRGRFLRGVDYDANRDPDKEKRGSDHNGNTGNKVGSIQEDAYKKHYHDLKLGGMAGKDKADSGNPKDSGIVKTEYSGDSDETRPKNAYVNWIIKYK